MNRQLLEELRAENAQDQIGTATDVERALMEVPERRLVGTAPYTRRVLPGLTGKRSATEIQDAYTSLSSKGLVVLEQELRPNHQVVTVAVKKTMDEIKESDDSLMAFMNLQLNIAEYRHAFCEEGRV